MTESKENAEIEKDFPAAPVRLNPKVPAKLEEIIAKAMEKVECRRDNVHSKEQFALSERCGNADGRAETEAGYVAHLPSFRGAQKLEDYGFGAVAIVVVLLAVTLFLFKRQQPKAPAPAAATGKTAIAVLPFTDLSANKDQEYFSDGLTEELTDMLAKNSKLRVISRTSAFSFKGKEVNIKTIAEQLNVTHVLEDRRAIELDPLRIAVHYNLGFHAYYGGLSEMNSSHFAAQPATQPALARILDENAPPLD